MAVVHRLAHLKTVYAADGTTQTQRKEEAFPAAPYSSVVAHLRLPVTATTGTLILQHAASQEDSAFVDISSPSFDLSTGANQVIQLTGILGFLRWKITGLTGDATFQLDLVAREH